MNTSCQGARQPLGEQEASKSGGEERRPCLGHLTLLQASQSQPCPSPPTYTCVTTHILSCSPEWP